MQRSSDYRTGTSDCSFIRYTSVIAKEMPPIGAGHMLSACPLDVELDGVVENAPVISMSGALLDSSSTVYYLYSDYRYYNPESVILV